MTGAECGSAVEAPPQPQRPPPWPQVPLVPQPPTSPQLPTYAVGDAVGVGGPRQRVAVLRAASPVAQQASLAECETCERHYEGISATRALTLSPLGARNARATDAATSVKALEGGIEPKQLLPPAVSQALQLVVAHQIAGLGECLSICARRSRSLKLLGFDQLHFDARLPPFLEEKAQSLGYLVHDMLLLARSLFALREVARHACLWRKLLGFQHLLREQGSEVDALLHRRREDTSRSVNKLNKILTFESANILWHAVSNWKRNFLERRLEHARQECKMREISEVKLKERINQDLDRFVLSAQKQGARIDRELVGQSLQDRAVSCWQLSTGATCHRILPGFFQLWKELSLEARTIRDKEQITRQLELHRERRRTCLQNWVDMALKARLYRIFVHWKEYCEHERAFLTKKVHAWFMSHCVRNLPHHTLLPFMEQCATNKTLSSQLEQNQRNCELYFSMWLRSFSEGRSARRMLSLSQRCRLQVYESVRTAFAKASQAWLHGFLRSWRLVAQSLKRANELGKRRALCACQGYMEALLAGCWTSWVLLRVRQQRHHLRHVEAVHQRSLAASRVDLIRTCFNACRVHAQDSRANRRRKAQSMVSAWWRISSSDDALKAQLLLGWARAANTSKWVLITEATENRIDKALVCLSRAKAGALRELHRNLIAVSFARFSICLATWRAVIAARHRKKQNMLRTDSVMKKDIASMIAQCFLAWAVVKEAARIKRLSDNALLRRDVAVKVVGRAVEQQDWLLILCCFLPWRQVPCMTSRRRLLERTTRSLVDVQAHVQLATCIAVWHRECVDTWKAKHACLVNKVEATTRLLSKRTTQAESLVTRTSIQTLSALTSSCFFDWRSCIDSKKMAIAQALREMHSRVTQSSYISFTGWAQAVREAKHLENYAQHDVATQLRKKIAQTMLVDWFNVSTMQIMRAVMCSWNDWTKALKQTKQRTMFAASLWYQNRWDLIQKNVLWAWGRASSSRKELTQASARAGNLLRQAKRIAGFAAYRQAFLMERIHTMYHFDEWREITHTDQEIARGHENMSAAIIKCAGYFVRCRLTTRAQGWFGAWIHATARAKADRYRVAKSISLTVAKRTIDLILLCFHGWHHIMAIEAEATQLAQAESNIMEFERKLSMEVCHSENLREIAIWNSVNWLRILLLTMVVAAWHMIALTKRLDRMRKKRCMAHMIRDLQEDANSLVLHCWNVWKRSLALSNIQDELQQSFRHRLAEIRENIGKAVLSQVERQVSWRLAELLWHCVVAWLDDVGEARSTMALAGANERGRRLRDRSIEHVAVHVAAPSLLTLLFLAWRGAVEAQILRRALSETTKRQRSKGTMWAHRTAHSVGRRALRLVLARCFSLWRLCLLVRLQYLRDERLHSRCIGLGRIAVLKLRSMLLKQRCLYHWLWTCPERKREVHLPIPLAKAPDFTKEPPKIFVRPMSATTVRPKWPIDDVPAQGSSTVHTALSLDDTGPSEVGEGTEKTQKVSAAVDRHALAARATTSDTEYRRLFEHNRREIREIRETSCPQAVIGWGVWTA